MFLSQLSSDNKIRFWNLANYMMRADGKVTKEEENMLDQYKQEMQMDCKYDEAANIAETISELAKEDKFTKRSIYFELLGLAYADAKYDMTEQAEMVKMQKLFGITDEESEKMEEYAVASINLYEKLMEIYANLTKLLL
ncbi:MAG: TerB family tellurite resistance protein [Synergistes sp.]|nr:TerB family tellurite resistance protein [Synergistes sp.]